MFGVFCIAMGVFVFVFMKETKGRSLEDMDLLFGAVSEEERRQDVEHALHKGGVTHAEYADEEAGVQKEETQTQTQQDKT